MIKKQIVWTAVITPFNNDSGNAGNGLTIDYKGLETILRLQEAANNGILLLGSTGEAMALSDNERKQVLEFAFSLKLSSPIMVGIGGINQEQTLEWLSYLETRPQIHAYLMVTPPYAKPGAKGQEAWFRALLDRSTRPCMLYNVPGRTGVSLNVSAIKALEGHPNFWAVKEASGSIADYQNYRRATPSITYFSGDDGMTPHFALYGCAGVVSVASNVWAHETHLFTKLCLEHKFTTLMPIWKDACDSLFTASNPIPVKALIHHLGLISTTQTRPPLSHLDLSSEGMQKLIISHQEIGVWFRSLAS